MLEETMQNIFQPLSKGVRPGFMDYVCGKKRKCHPVLISYRCNVFEEKNMSIVKHGETIYPGIRCMTSNHDIYELKIRRTRIVHKLNEVLKRYKHQYTVYGEVLDKGKRRKAREKLNECIFTLNLYKPNRNGGV